MPRVELDAIAGRHLYTSTYNLRAGLISGLASSACVRAGVLKTYLSSSAFTYCSTTARPCNTLLHKIANPISISYDDMEDYMSLILGLYQLSPMGLSALLKVMMASFSCDAMCCMDKLRRIWDDRFSTCAAADG